MSNTFKAAVVAAAVASVISAGAAVATTQTFTLGTTNRVDAQTKVTNLQSNGNTVNPVDGPLLTLDNRSASTNATPLSLVATSGHAALKVNTQTKVTNLNADQVDGLDSSRFMRGIGSVISSHIAEANDGTQHTVITLPGLGVVKASCTLMNPAASSLAFTNTSGDGLDISYESNGATPTYTLLGLNSTVSFSTAPGSRRVLWLINKHNGGSGPVTQLTTMEVALSSSCQQQAVAVLSTG